MFDFAWTEIALIGVVALVAIGPKDLPVAIKTVANMIKKARRMAGEFQTHVDEMVREANLDEVRSQISQIRNLDIKGTIERAVDSDGSIRKTFTEDPLVTNFATATPPSYTEPVTTGSLDSGSAGEAAAALDVAPEGSRNMERPAWLDSAASGGAASPANDAPAFIPPAIANPTIPPPFIPPGTTPGGSRPYA